MYENVVGDELVENMSTAKALTVPATAKRFLAQAIGGTVFLRFAGTATTSLGHAVADGAFAGLLPVHPGKVSVIAANNTPKLFVTYFG